MLAATMAMTIRIDFFMMLEFSGTKITKIVLMAVFSLILRQNCQKVC
jgi:hypothetical protein